MRFRLWPLLAVAFGALLLVVAVSAAALYRSMGRVYSEVSAIQENDWESAHVLSQLRSEVYTLAVVVRDYLSASSGAAAAHRQTLNQLRGAIQDHLKRLDQLQAHADAATMRNLHLAIDEYWASIEPVLGWDATNRSAQGEQFLRYRLAPYRKAVLSVAQKLEELNAMQVQRRRREILETQLNLRGQLKSIAAVALLLGFLAAGISVAAMFRLERAATRHRREVERGADELRRLSLKLVNAQEEERRNISRELHDQVGQMLTALRMELGSLEQLRFSAGTEFPHHAAEAKKLAEDTLRAVRNLSMGLRPAMLDQLGLVPALKWQAREFTRRTGVPVDLETDGDLDSLDEIRTTCAYRVVQEALTNCARHAKAASVRITLHGGGDSLALTVEDDGAGFLTGSVPQDKFGLLGMQERIRELNGRIEVISDPGRGTLLRCEIPLARKIEA